MPIFDGEALLITLDATGGVGVVDATVDLYTEWKLWQNENGTGGSSNKRYPPAFSPTGGEPLTPGISAGSYSFIRNDLGWRMRPFEEDATILFVGNLVPFDSTLPVAVPTIGDYTVMILGLQPITQSVAEILILQQETSFNGEVHVNLDDGTPGTAYPIGTASEPSDNMTDARLIAARLRIEDFFLHGDLIFSANLDGATVSGRGIPSSVDFNGFSARLTSFFDLDITGNATSDTHAHFTRCTLKSITGVSGFWRNCGFNGTTILSAPPAEHMNYVENSSSAVAGTGTPAFDMDNLAMTFQLRGWIGGVELLNCTDPTNNVSIDVISGNVKLGASNTEGVIVVRGTGSLTDNTGPNCTVISSIVNPDTVAEAVRSNLSPELAAIPTTLDHARATNSQTQGTP